MPINRVSPIIGYTFSRVTRNNKTSSKPDVKLEYSNMQELFGSGRLDSNGVIKVTTQRSNTFDSNVWYELDETGTVKIQTPWTEPGKELIRTNEQLKGLYRFVSEELVGKDGSIANDNALWIVNRISIAVYD